MHASIGPMRDGQPVKCDAQSPWSLRLTEALRRRWKISLEAWMPSGFPALGAGSWGAAIDRECFLQWSISV
jgi:hypothetical protein